MAAGSDSISVFAAASLTDTFKALGSSFERDHAGATVRFNFAGTPTLATQIGQGAHADVFASADTENMDRLKADGFVIGEPKVFAHNKLRSSPTTSSRSSWRRATRRRSRLWPTSPGRA